MKKEVYTWMLRWVKWTLAVFLSPELPRELLRQYEEEIQQIRKDYVELVNQFAPELFPNWPNFDSLAYVPRHIRLLGPMRYCIVSISSWSKQLIYKWTRGPTSLIQPSRDMSTKTGEMMNKITKMLGKGNHKNIPKNILLEVSQALFLPNLFGSSTQTYDSMNIIMNVNRLFHLQSLIQWKTSPWLEKAVP